MRIHDDDDDDDDDDDHLQRNVTENEFGRNSISQKVVFSFKTKIYSWVGVGTDNAPKFV